MTAKQIYRLIYKSAILALCTSYLTQSFYRWEFNPGLWPEDGRMAFIFTYLFVVVMSAVVSSAIELESKKEGK